MKQKRIAECKCNSLAPYSGKEVNGKIEYGKNLMKHRKIYLAVFIGCLLMTAIYYQIESHFLINRNPFFYTEDVYTFAFSYTNDKEAKQTFKHGKTVESWTSEEKPHYIEMLPIGEYTLREETAPDGYLVAEDVKFTVKDTGEIQKVVMKDEVKPTETPTETPAETPETTSTPETKDTETTKTSTSPKTGDNTPILFWILLAGVGMAGVGGTVILRKKKKK